MYIYIYHFWRESIIIATWQLNKKNQRWTTVSQCILKRLLRWMMSWDNYRWGALQVSWFGRELWRCWPTIQPKNNCFNIIQRSIPDRLKEGRKEGKKESGRKIQPENRKEWTNESERNAGPSSCGGCMTHNSWFSPWNDHQESGFSFFSDE